MLHVFGMVMWGEGGGEKYCEQQGRIRSQFADHPSTIEVVLALPNSPTGTPKEAANFWGSALAAGAQIFHRMRKRGKKNKRGGFGLPGFSFTLLG